MPWWVKFAWFLYIWRPKTKIFAWECQSFLFGPKHPRTWFSLDRRRAVDPNPWNEPSWVRQRNAFFYFSVIPFWLLAWRRFAFLFCCWHTVLFFICFIPSCSISSYIVMNERFDATVKRVLVWLAQSMCIDCKSLV